MVATGGVVFEKGGTIDTLNEVLNAKRPEDLFGTMDVLTDHEKGFCLKKMYKQFARKVHPDILHDPRAEEAFAHLGKLHNQALHRIRTGVYGTNTFNIDIKTKRHTYTITEVYDSTDVAVVYRAEYDSDKNALIKVAKRPQDNEYLKTEIKNVKHILSNQDTYDDASPYLPPLIEGFTYKTKGGNRQAVVFKETPNLYTLHQVREHYPNGVHTKDMAWMLRRILFALGYAHKNGVLHGALLPQHIFIEPAQHGVILSDWYYSVQRDEKIKAISRGYKEWYPHEVLEKKTPSIGTDIWLVIKSMTYILGGDPRTGHLPDPVPKPMRAFFRGCTLKSQKQRPQSAWTLLEEFDELIERLYGPRRFRPFHM